MDHARELNNVIPEEPVLFLKPETAILLKKQPFFLPDFSNDVHHEIELVVRVNKIGKHIPEKFAHKYYNEITVGIDFTARDLQKKLKEKGLPWEKAKAFDGSACVGKFIPKELLSERENINFHLHKNGEIVQKGITSDMIFSINQLISYISTFFTLKIGDLIFTGTPAGVGKVSKDDYLQGFLENQQLFSLNVK